MSRCICLITALSFLTIIYHSVFANSLQNYDESSTIGTEVQDSQVRSLALPSRLIINTYSLYDNPSRVAANSGVYIDGCKDPMNTWGGVVIPCPYTIKAGFFVRRPLADGSALRNALIEPSTGSQGAFSSMVSSGSTVLGVIDPDSQYFNDSTAFPTKSLSSLTTGNGEVKSFGNMDAFQGIQFRQLHFGFMESYNTSSQKRTETIQNGSSRSLGYSASEARITGGISTDPIGIVESDIMCSYSKQSMSFNYSAVTSATYPKVGYESKSESLYCNSGDAMELDFLARTVVDLGTMKVYGAITYSKYEVPIDVHGKLFSSTYDDTHIVRYLTSKQITSYDAALHQKLGTDGLVIYSCGYTYIKSKYSKNTVVSPSSSEGSIWGSSAIHDNRTTEVHMIPVGVAIEYKINEKVTLRSGLRKYIFAPYSSTYTGQTGTATQSASSKGKYAYADQFVAGSGVSVVLTPSITFDSDISMKNCCIAETTSKATTFDVGASIKYGF